MVKNDHRHSYSPYRDASAFLAHDSWATQWVGRPPVHTGYLGDKIPRDEM